MAVKDFSQLIASFADNISGNIGADDMRDYVESIWSVRGDLELATPITTFGLTTTPVAVDFFDTVGANNLNVTDNLGAGTLTTIAAGAGLYLVSFIMTYTPDANNADVAVRLLINGSVARPNWQIVGTSSLGRLNSIVVAFPFSAPSASSFAFDIAVLAGTLNIDVDFAALGIARIGG